MFPPLTPKAVTNCRVAGSSRTAESGYGVQLTAGPFVFSFPGELQFTM